MNLSHKFSGLLAAALLVVFFVPLAAADEWAHGTATDTDPNEIIKWCQVDGSGVRYASANLAIKGYQPCGKLHASKTCDATGVRFISPQAETDSPHGYLDCSKGQRIFIKRHDEGAGNADVENDSGYDSGAKQESSPDSSPLSSDESLKFENFRTDKKIEALTPGEKRALKKQLSKIEKSGGIEKQLYRQLMAAFGGLDKLIDPKGNPGNGNNSFKNPPDLEKLLKQLDPQLWKELERQLGRP